MPPQAGFYHLSRRLSHYTPRSLRKHNPRLEGEATLPSSARFLNVPLGSWRQIPWTILTVLSKTSSDFCSLQLEPRLGPPQGIASQEASDPHTFIPGARPWPAVTALGKQAEPILM